MNKKKMGRPKADNPKSEKVQIRFTKAELDRIKMRAIRTDQTMAQVIREGLKDLIQPTS